MGPAIRKGRGYLVLLCAAFFALSASAQVRVKGYVRKDGTYVAPHYRSSPNSSRSDNYSARGNYNPYTGKRGSVDPYAPPTYSAPSYSAPSYNPSTTYPTSSNYDVERARAQAERAQVEAEMALARLKATQQLVEMRAQLTADLRSGLRNPKSLSEAELYLLGNSFHGEPCTEDCSGHEAGYQWAEQSGIYDPDDCSGNSASFVEGCQLWAEEQADDEGEDY